MAKEHIEGKISINEADKRIAAYYEERRDREEVEVDTKEALDYDFSQEKDFSYEGLSLDESVRHIAKFTSGIWQIHPLFFENLLLNVGHELKNPTITQKELAAIIGKSERTIKTRTVEMQDKGLICRENGKRNGKWKVLVEI